MKLLIIFIALIVTTGLFSEVITIYPTDNMYTDPDNPGNPDLTQLWTANFQPSGNFQRIMMNFDLSTFQEEEIKQAILNLTRFYSCFSGGTTATTFYAIAEVWCENSWPHTRHINYDEEVSMAYVFSGTGGNTINHFSIDITDFLNSILNQEYENKGFVIKANNNQRFSKFYSTRFAVESYRPSLDLTLKETSVNNQLAIEYGIKATNFPNPFNPSTTIEYKIPHDSAVKIDIFNIKGQLVYELLNDYKRQGQHTIVWDGRLKNGSVAESGIFFYKITTNSETLIDSMVIVK